MSEEMSLDLACANAIRALAMDAVQQANSGHPGAPMERSLLSFTSGWDLTHPVVGNDQFSVSPPDGT